MMREESHVQNLKALKIKSPGQLIVPGHSNFSYYLNPPHHTNLFSQPGGLKAANAATCPPFPHYP